MTQGKIIFTETDVGPNFVHLGVAQPPICQGLTGAGHPVRALRMTSLNGTPKHTFAARL